MDSPVGMLCGCRDLSATLWKAPVSVTPIARVELTCGRAGGVQGCGRGDGGYDRTCGTCGVKLQAAEDDEATRTGPGGLVVAPVIGTPVQVGMLRRLAIGESD